jgi:hypothetical protein
MTTETGPVRPVPSDAAAQRRRTWGTGAGILLVGAVVVVAMVIAGNSGPSKPSPTPVRTAAAVAAAPTSAAAAAAPTTATSAAEASTSAASTTAASTAATSTPTAARTTSVLDVDGDGRPDRALTQFATGRTAQVVVRLATGKTLTSKVFPLYKQGGAGKVFAADVNGDHHSELLVSDPGADGIGYHLFSYVGASLVAVPLPTGNGLYIGGGMYYDSTFGCAGERLLQVNEAPQVKGTANLPPDPPFRVTTTTYALTGGRLRATGTTTVGVANRAAAEAKIEAIGNGCGTRA